MSEADHIRPQGGPAAWRGAELAAADAFAFTLEDRHVAALDRALENARRLRLPIESIDRRHFPLDDIETDLARLRREVESGRGLVILRGFPVERYGDDDAMLAFWGLGTHLGRAVSQSLMGDRLGHVLDVSRENPGERGYRSRKELDFHTDSDNIVAMLCLRPAKRGGLSRFVSAVAVHDVILAEAPELLALLYRGFRYHWRGEEAPGEAPITAYRVPVFSAPCGVLSCVFLRAFIEWAADDLGEPLSAKEAAAIDLFHRVCDRKGMALELTLGRGDAFLINNFSVVHSRTEFEDHENEAERRHLLRLWLKTRESRPLDEAVRRYYRDDGIDSRAGADTVFERAAQDARR